jgi:hypothetical protein
VLPVYELALVVKGNRIRTHHPLSVFYLLGVAGHPLRPDPAVSPVSGEKLLCDFGSDFDYLELSVTRQSQVFVEACPSRYPYQGMLAELWT